MTLKRRVQRLEDRMPIADPSPGSGLSLDRLSIEELEDLERIGTKFKNGVDLSPAEVERVREILRKARGGD